MKKKTIAFGMILLILTLNGCVSSMNNSSDMKQTPSKKIASSIKSNRDSLESRFALLSAADTNFCAGPNFIYSKSDNDRLQGSCCSAMDFHRYKEQVEGLKEYSNIKLIPSDPYDIEVLLAKELLSYQSNIKLTPEQQEIYHKATKLSHEGGPCCCICWRWHAFEGLAKYLITEHNFNSEQVADVWDLIDGCGGEGHVHGMHT